MSNDPPMPDPKSPQARYRYNHVCTGCDCAFSDCQPLWAESRKCCPDCSHHRAFPRPTVPLSAAREQLFETAVAEATRKAERIISDAHKLARIKATSDSLMWAAKFQQERLKRGWETVDAKELAKALRIGKRLRWRFGLVT